MSMKVLWVTNGYPTKNNPEYCVFTKDQIAGVKKEGVDGTIIFINAREKGRNEYFKAIGKIRKEVSDGNYDLIHCFHGLTYLLVSTFHSGVPILVSFLNSIDNEYADNGKILSSLFKIISVNRLLKSRTGVILKDKIPNEFQERNNTFHLPNGVDLETFYPMNKIEAKSQLGLDLHKKYILFVSSKSIKRPQKRYDIYKSTVNLLKEKYDLKMVEELTISNLPREKLIYYYNSADIHLMTSDFEGSPNSVKEALACSTPVVSTDVGNVREMIEGIPGCKVSKTNTPEELALHVYNSLKMNNIETRNFIKNKRLDINSKSKDLYKIYCQLIEDYNIYANG